MKTVFVLYPHQLFEHNTHLQQDTEIYIVEEHLYYNQYAYHKQKIVLHRASMQYYAAYLRGLKYTVHYIDAQNALCHTKALVTHLAQQKVTTIEYIDVVDNWLHKHLTTTAVACNIKLVQYPSSMFLNNATELNNYFGGKGKYHQTDFYTQQRKTRNILIDADGKPTGGKWTFDAENREKYPKGATPPRVTYPTLNTYYKEAIAYTQKHYNNNLGSISTTVIYPTTFDESKAWLRQFFTVRFAQFGVYEDALVQGELLLHHSMLTPMLNIGLLTPEYVIQEALQYAAKHNVPINSLEGFVRQIVGWREFIRAVYLYKGTVQRTTNYWGYTRAIPQSFYNGTTGIAPIDEVIHKILATGYCHHIERLMVLGNFMLLCEFDPNAVHQWFMELFIDAYDWVMVPNVYGMTQFADGGLMATKPYISGSNYLFKMSNYTKPKPTSGTGWDATWDGLFWHFMHKQRKFFLSNPRLSMLIHTWDKMPETKRDMHTKNATDFLAKLGE